MAAMMVALGCVIPLSGRACRFGAVGDCGWRDRFVAGSCSESWGGCAHIDWFCLVYRRLVEKSLGQSELSEGTRRRARVEPACIRAVGVVLACPCGRSSASVGMVGYRPVRVMVAVRLSGEPGRRTRGQMELELVAGVECLGGLLELEGQPPPCPEAGAVSR